MKRFAMSILVLLLCSSCALTTRLTTGSIQDTADAKSNAVLAEDEAGLRCSITKADVAKKAAQLKVSGPVSAVMAKRALRKWSEEVQLDCAEVIVDGMAWVRRFVPGGL